MGKLLSAPQQDDLDGFEQNPEVEKQRGIFDVIKIVLKFLDCVFDRRTITVIDLRPTSQTGFDEMALIIERNRFAQLFNGRTSSP